MIAALRTLTAAAVKGKRVAVLADMLELGEWSEKEHRAIGDFVVSLNNVAYLLTYGSLSKSTTERAEQLGMKNAFNFKNKPELIDYLNQIISKNDLLLIKGSRGMAMEEVTKGLVET
jgi:UDP-N-acetylmuramoyl-tripeptide--D-alanyl-D-alanine ligase